MDKFKNYYKVASIINFVMGILFLSNLIYSAILFVFGFICYVASTSTYEKLKENKTFLLIINIIYIPINFVAALIALIGWDKIKEYKINVNGTNGPPVIIKKVVNPEVKKINILLKLGVGMVFISGILFVTTSWTFISGLTKVILLILFGILFIGLSAFTEKKLKLTKTTYMYWILGMSFLLLSVVGIQYFNVFTDYLSYSADGKYFAYAITYLTLLGLAFATYLKFSKEYLIYIIYTCFLLIITNILKQLTIDNVLIISIISIILFITNIITNKNNKLSRYTELLCSLMFAFIIRRLTSSNEYYILIASIINIIIQYYFTKEDDISIFRLIIIYLLITTSIYNINALDYYTSILVFTITTINTIIIKFNIIKTNNNYSLTNYILYTILSIINFAIAYNYNQIFGIQIAIIHLIINIILSKKIENTKEIKLAMYLEPLTIFITFISILYYKSFSFDISFVLATTLTTIILCLCHLIIKDNNHKLAYLISIYISIILCLITNYYYKEKLSSILIIISSIYIYFFTNKSNDFYKIFNYLLLVLSIYISLNIVNILEISTLLSSIILIWILIVFILLSNKEIIKRISYFVLILPIFDLINYFEFEYELRTICSSILVLYITFLIVKFLCKDKFSRNLLSIIGIVLAVITTFNPDSYVIGMYIAILGLIITFIGYFNNELSSLFITGVIITITNIIYQLRDLWYKIPFWLYLLLGGLSIIGFVTYKEINRKK